MTEKTKIASKLLIVGGVVNIVSALIHVVLPTYGNWDELFANVPPDYLKLFAIRSKEYLWSSNYELVFICGGAGIMSFRYASRLRDGSRMLAWFSVWMAIVLLYRASVQFYFFGTSIYSIGAFIVILGSSAAYMYPLFYLKHFDKE